MIVVPNRVRVPSEREDTFVERLRQSHGIEDHDGFAGLQLLSPVDAEEHITMTYWESFEDYDAWRESTDFHDAHDDTSAEQAFEVPQSG